MKREGMLDSVHLMAETAVCDCYYLHVHRVTIKTLGVIKKKQLKTAPYYFLTVPRFEIQVQS